MPDKINPKILIAELKRKIREFYPYFFGFYFLSLLVAIFSPTWRTFFYWPAFHGALIFFTLLFLLTFKLEWEFTPGFRLGHLTRESLKKPRVLTISYFIFIRTQLAKLSRRDWLKIAILTLVLAVALFRNIDVINFLILAYAFSSFLYILDSRISAGTALFFLAACPLLLIIKKGVWAETAAVYAYYFLVITVFTQIRELRSEKSLQK